MKHGLTSLLVITAIAAGSVGLSSQDDRTLTGQDDRTIYGAGTNSCAQWMEARKTQAWFTAGQWVLGFVSAANYYSKTPPARSDARSMAKWVDDYCRDRSESDLAEAAQELTEALLRAKLQQP